MAKQKHGLLDPEGGSTTSGKPKTPQGKDVHYSNEKIQLLGDQEVAYKSEPKILSPAFQADSPDTRLYVGDCREILPNIPDQQQVDLVFADPPFNWDVP